MTIIQSIFLGALQGITEFLPISSSGHLVLLEHFLKIKHSATELLIFDIILHSGSLLALLIYFKSKWKQLIISIWKYFSLKNNDQNKILIKVLILGTIPIIGTALFAKDFIEQFCRNPFFVLMMMGLMGVIFLLVEKKSKPNQNKIKFKSGIIIGIMQSFALLPGISRSGITISTGIFQGISRKTAAEFSFLLGTMSLIAAIFYVGLNIIIKQQELLPLSLLISGLISSFLSSIISIHFLLKFLQKYSLKIFAFYLLIICFIGLIFLKI